MHASAGAYDLLPSSMLHVYVEPSVGLSKIATGHADRARGAGHAGTVYGVPRCRGTAARSLYIYEHRYSR